MTHLVRSPSENGSIYSNGFVILDEQLDQQARMIPPNQLEAQTVTYVSTNPTRGTGCQDDHRNINGTVAIETNFTPRFSNPTWRSNFNANWRRN